VVDFRPERQHQGWQGIAHGGIVATILDEMMTRLLYEQERNAVTAEMTVRYHRPLVTGESVQARARVQEDRGRLIRTTAELRDQSGELIASAEGKFVIVRDR
jgi:uncharacterized protein (TIGR00369 family)